jgi:hypothetical protein
MYCTRREARAARTALVIAGTNLRGFGVDGSKFAQTDLLALQATTQSIHCFAFMPSLRLIALLWRERGKRVLRGRTSLRQSSSVSG